MILTHADTLRTHLLADESLLGVAVHVDRKLDIRELAAAELGRRASGAFVSISLGGWTPMNPDGGQGEYWATLRYELSFATVPHILEELDMATFDELLRRLVASIHGWAPSPAQPAYCPGTRWRVGGGSYVPDDDFLVYLFPATIDADLAASS